MDEIFARIGIDQGILVLLLMVLVLLCMSITNQFGDEEKGELLK